MNKTAALILPLVLLGVRSARPQTASKPAFAPVAYFQQNCARCHGDYGSNYGDQFAKNLSDEQLCKVVDDMCSGPGNAPLSGEDLQEEIAFHRALADGRPFVCITSNVGDRLSGESSDGAKVIVHQGTNELPAKVDGTQWSIEVKPSAEARIVADLHGKQTALALADKYSHRAATTQPVKK